MVNEIDYRKIEERVSFLIENKGNVSFYVPVPDRFRDKSPTDEVKIVSKFEADGVNFWRHAHMSALDAFINRIMHLTVMWTGARFYENNPLSVLSKMKRPYLWFRNTGRYFDHQFEKLQGEAYKGLQECEPLQQADIKDLVSAYALHQLDLYNQDHSHQPAPLDAFVAEQVRRIPSEVLDKVYGGHSFRWVYGDGRTVAYESTIHESLAYPGEPRLYL